MRTGDRMRRAPGVRRALSQEGACWRRRNGGDVLREDAYTAVFTTAAASGKRTFGLPHPHG